MPRPSATWEITVSAPVTALRSVPFAPRVHIAPEDIIKSLAHREDMYLFPAVCTLYTVTTVQQGSTPQAAGSRGAQIVPVGKHRLPARIVATLRVAPPASMGPRAAPTAPRGATRRARA